MEYTIHEVVERTGLAPRTIREWTSRGAVARPSGRGPGTRYSEDLVLRLMAVQRFREQGMPMRTIKSELRRMSLAQVAAFLGEPLPEDEEEDAEEAPPPAPPAPAPPPLPSATAPGVEPRALAPARGAALPPGQPFVIAWLLPQLGLIVGQNAPPLVRRIAGEIYERYAAQETDGG
ncbi:MAG TPA: helix-turn-helix domain-containing protein [Polyangiaceae bacterium]